MITIDSAGSSGKWYSRLVAVVLMVLVAAGAWYWNVARARKTEPGESTIHDVSPEDFIAYLAGDTPGILEFYTSSCPFCSMIEPELQKLKAEYGDEVFIVKMNAERYPHEASKYNVRGVPTLIFFDKSGNPKASLAGYRDAEGIADILRQLGFIK